MTGILSDVCCGKDSLLQVEEVWDFPYSLSARFKAGLPCKLSK